MRANRPPAASAVPTRMVDTMPRRSSVWVQTTAVPVTSSEAVRGSSEVGRAVGYPRSSTFATAFTREVGCSPTAWRKQHRG